MQKVVADAARRKAANKRKIEQVQAGIAQDLADTRAKVAKTSHNASKQSAGVQPRHPAICCDAQSDQDQPHCV